MKIVVKLGGATIADPSLLNQTVQAIALLADHGEKIFLVHGGGTQMTQLMAAMGKKSEFIDGLRVTDEATRDAALMMLAGKLNKSLVASFIKEGQSAIGVCGGDAGMVRAKKKVTDPDLGFVGEITKVETGPIQSLWDMGTIPIMSSITLGNDGQYYNVNADEMATACAIALKADALVFLTDVPGLMGAEGQVIRTLQASDIQRLKDTHVITGGMLPKVDACVRAMNAGVGQVQLLPATMAGAISGIWNEDFAIGTKIVQEKQLDICSPGALPFLSLQPVKEAIKPGIP